MDGMDPTQNTNMPPHPHDRDIEENKDIAALGYVWVLSIFVYAYKRSSPFVAFHAKQGIALFILSIACWFIPVAGRLIELVILALAVMGFLAAAQGHRRELPLVYALSNGDMHGLRRSWKTIVESAVNLWHRFRRTSTKNTQPTSSTTSVTPSVIELPPSPPSNL
jgi:uncharacterized membrane protein